jgi:1-acyl-sn-glycerol-3-phosphate acyltransferase
MMLGGNMNNEKSQFALLKTQRFAPFFWTQFLGAFNDNVFKNALILLIAYRGTAHVINADIMINAAAGLFILPFFLLSAIAGQLADKYEKSKLIQWIKLFEIGIMVVATAGFFMHNLSLLMFLLFCMGVHSTLFGPAKYSIIPQHLNADEIVGGNALVEMGTFVAILLGTILGGILIPLKDGELWVSLAVCAIAIAGWLSSRKIPLAESPSPELIVNWNPFTQIWKTIQFSRRVHSVFLSILAISWFWFIGAAYLTQLPNFTKQVLRSSESVVTLLLTMFSVGIGVGSLLCERLSGKKVELGLVPLGSIGLSIFGIDLFFAYTPPAVENLMGIGQFLQTSGSFRLLADLVLIGVSGGLYTVPLYAFIQIRTEAEFRSRIIAAGNIISSMFMVTSSIMGALMLGVAKLTIPQFFLTLALMNIAVAVYIYTVVPEFVMRFLIWIITHTFYRVRHTDLGNIPNEGPAVLVSNHVSFMDGPIIAGACRRPIRFVMFEPIYRLPVLNFIFKTGKAIPIDSQRTAPETYRKAFESIAEALNDGEVVCLFPEGKLTEDGEIDVFKPGIERILKKNPVPVIPLALRGLWGSFFSKKVKMSRLSGRFWSKIEVIAETPLAPEGLTAEKLREVVKELRGATP